ncbi:MAG: hypothetical protein KBA26_12140, partial [Candidatus Delongbacteria bacterium]|nr:hypothetical protein [Candidatus Delongbacteria bacterium]
MKIDRGLWLIILFFLSGHAAALPPQFITPSSIDTLFENIEFQKIIQARDPENDSFFFTLILKPNGVTDSLWNDSTLAVNWIPQVADVGQHGLSVVVQDTTGLKDTLELTWRVFKKNDPPFFVENDIEVILQQGEIYNHPFIYRDPDLDHSFTFTTLHKPSSMQINSIFTDSSILVNWQPANPDVGVDSLRFIIRDDSLASDTLRVRFAVSNRNDPPRFIPNELTDTLSQGVAYQREVKVIDEDIGDSLRFAILRKPDLMTIEFDYTDTTLLIQWTPTLDQIGPDSIILQVRDDSLASDTLKGALIVLNRNDPPQPGTILYPTSGQVLTDRQLNCRMTKGSDPDASDTLLSYRFLLFYDPTTSPGVADEWSSPWIQTADDIIEYTFPDSLDEDSYYYLMAQVRDDSMAVSDYDSVRFFVNTFNQLPSFDYYTPGEGAIVPNRSPRLRVTEATDSDDSVFFYSFIIMNGTGSEMLDSAYNRSLNQYTTDEVLMENGKFLWSARVQDESGGYTDWKTLRSFYVNSLEEAPFPPQKFWIYGMDSVSHYISVSNPTFTWEIPSLPDPDPLTQKSDIRFLLQIYADTNSAPIYQVNSEKGGTYYFFSEGELIERVRYYARITAIDPTGLYSTPSSYL